jgi:DNA-binding CsgD family transcriptional regulator
MHEDIKEAKQLYASGHPVATIGQKLNYNPKTIWNRLTKAGVRMRDTYEQ